MTTEDPVVIENQFGPTDHDHLGKLLTYATGIDAGFVVWVAESFRDEHRSVLDWLNDRDVKGTRFFGIRPRVTSIGDDGTSGEDTVGFEFTVDMELNDWERDFRKPSAGREQAYREFFTQLVDVYAEEHPRWNPPTPQTRSYLTFGVGVSRLEFAWVFHRETEFAVELYIDTGETERSETIIDALRDHQTMIEAEVNSDLVWERLADRRACRIKMARRDSGPVEGLSTSEQYNLIEWGSERMESFRDVVEPQLQNL